MGRWNIFNSSIYCNNDCLFTKMKKLMISHGDSHPFGEKCKTCDKIKKEYEIDMGIKDKNSLHNHIHKEGFEAGYKKGVKDVLDKYRKIFNLI